MNAGRQGCRSLQVESRRRLQPHHRWGLGTGVIRRVDEQHLGVPELDGVKALACLFCNSWQSAGVFGMD
jgi:hypothetical protein